MTTTPKPLRRVRPTTPEKLRAKASEGQRAAHWREHVLRMGRPELGAVLDISPMTIKRIEEGDAVPVQYRLACAAVAAGVSGFAWSPIAPAPDPRIAAIAEHIRAALALVDG